MKLARTLFVATLVISTVACLRTATAAEDPIEFLHALQDNGYGDVAVDYLESIKDQPKAPKEVMELWDLEMSRSLRAAARAAYNADDLKKSMEKSETYLTKFLKEKPNHPEAIRAGAWRADTLGQEAVQDLRRAKDLKDKTQQEAAMTKVRTTLQEVRPFFVKAAESTKKTLDKTPAKSRKRPELESQLIENKLKIAIADFFITQTYTDPKSPERSKGLADAAKAFDAIYQANRATIFGMQAHFLHGRTSQEDGNYEMAQSIYEEVLASPETEMGVASLLAEVEQFYLQCLARKGIKDYFREAIEWRAQHKSIADKVIGYQAISFELAKNYLTAAEKANAADKKTFTNEAIKILTELGRLAGPYKQDAIKLRLQYKGEGAEVGFDEAIVLADEQAQRKQWMEAAEQYRGALKVASKSTKKEKIDNVRNAIAGCYYNKACEDFRKGKVDDTAKALKLISTEFRDTEMAPMAVALSLNVAMNQYATTTEGNDEAAKKAALKEVTDTAKLLKDTWPNRPEADAARLALGRLKIFSDQIDEAAKIFKEMNPKSEHYGTALYLTGYTYWRSYKTEKRQADEKPEKDAKKAAEAKQKRDEMRTKAITAIRTACESMKGLPLVDNKPPRLLTDSQLLLGEMMLESEDPKAAAALFQPLIDEAKKSAKSLDPPTLQAFNGAVQAYMQLNEMDKAATSIEGLLKLGPDATGVNTALLGFAKRLESEWVKADTAATQSLGAKAEQAKTNRDSYGKLLRSILTNLAERQKVSNAGRVWVAQKCAQFDMPDQAEKLANSLLDAIDNDANVANEIGKATARLRTLLISIQRKNQKFAEANAQVDKLIADNPKALELLMEKGWILQAWSEKDSANYAKAVLHWEKLRRSLERMKKKLPDFYTVTYNEALCLYKWAQKDGDKENVKKGLQLLKPLLMLDPKLNGPDTVARFRALVDQLESLQGVESSAKTSDAAK